MESSEKPEMAKQNIHDLYFSLWEKAKQVIKQGGDASKIFLPLELKGLKYVKPEEIGYPNGFNGSCVQLVEHITGLTNDEYYAYVNNDKNSTPEPMEGGIVVYKVKFPGDKEWEGKHTGIIKNGKVISKVVFGPIFIHDINSSNAIDLIVKSIAGDEEIKPFFYKPIPKKEG